MEKYSFFQGLLIPTLRSGVRNRPEVAVPAPPPVRQQTGIASQQNW